jgi:hypothetical protein
VVAPTLSEAPPSTPGPGSSPLPASSTAQEQASAIEAAMDLHTLDASASAPSYSYPLLEMTRFKRGRQAEQAMAAGQPLSYTLRAYGLVCESQQVVHQCEPHVQALASGAPHVWPDAPWSTTPAGAHASQPDGES